MDAYTAGETLWEGGVERAMQVTKLENKGRFSMRQSRVAVQDWGEVEAEAEKLLIDVKGKHIASVLEWFEADSQEGRIMCWVLPYYPVDVSTMSVPISKITARNLLKQVATALRVFHEQHILHGSVRPQNIFIKNPSQDTSENYTFVLSARLIGPESEPDRYKPPEGWIHPKSDLFGLGVVVAELIHKSFDFEEPVQSIATGGFRAFGKMLASVLGSEYLERPDLSAVVDFVSEMAETVESSSVGSGGTGKLESRIIELEDKLQRVAPPPAPPRPVPEGGWSTSKVLDILDMFSAIKKGQMTQIDVLNAFHIPHPNAGVAPIHAAAENCHIVAVKLLAEGFTTAQACDNRGFSALHYAASGGSCEVARMLVERYNVSVKGRSSSGDTAAHSAAYHGQDRMLQLLLDMYKIDPELRDSLGNNVLHAAASGGQIDTIKMLVSQYGANLKERSSGGYNILQVAAKADRTTCVQWLIEQAGVPVDSVSTSGASALHSAAGFGALNVVKLLLWKYDVNPFAKNKGVERKRKMTKKKRKGGTTPEEYASKNHHHAAVAMIKEKQAEWRAASQGY